MMITQQPAVMTAAKRSGHATTARRFPLLDKYFYFFMSLLIAAVVVYGFSHTVDKHLIHATPPRPWLLWLHGFVFTSWLVFFILQSALVRTHNVKLHRWMGWWGAGLAASMSVLGVATAIVMGRFFIALFPAETRGIEAFLIEQLWDMIEFTTLFWLAIYWRRKPEFHRRLILLATCVLTSAGFGRFPHWLVPLHWYDAGIALLFLLCIARDLIVNRRVHAVYRYAVPTLVFGQLFVLYTYLHQSPWWMRISHAILRA